MTRIYRKHLIILIFLPVFIVWKLFVYRSIGIEIKEWVSQEPGFPVYDLEESWNNSTLVFLHIQKTGGTTFGDHLVRHLNSSNPCRCKKPGKVALVNSCSCTTQQKRHWMFSRFSTGWRCGVHPGYAELKPGGCLTREMDKLDGEHHDRRYLLVTILRDPVARTVSEWQQVSTFKQWPQAGLKCPLSKQTLNKCAAKNWTGVTLQQFLNCSENPAWNRQVRMLTDLAKYNCSQADARMLEEAKERLRTMAFFGLMEHQNASRVLFERTFGVKFTQSFTAQLNTAKSRVQSTSTSNKYVNVNKDDLEQIRRLNNLDIELYKYAEDLFLKRISSL